MKPTRVADTFRFITGYAPAFREAAERLERAERDGGDDVTHRSVEVPVVARVEGEGALHVRIDDDEITRLELEIYEPPRFFESFLRGRHFSEVSDIVPRICGICPVAYQMTRDPRPRAALRGRGPRGHVRAAPAALLRRVDREPHAPRAPAGRARLPRVRLGDRDGSEAASSRQVERGLASEADRERRDGGDRRPRDPPGVADGGRLQPRGHEERAARVRRLGSRTRSPRSSTSPTSSRRSTMPDFPRDAELVSMVNAADYPLNDGEMVSTRGRTWTADTYEQVTAGGPRRPLERAALGLHRHADAVLRRAARPREPERGDSSRRWRARPPPGRGSRPFRTSTRSRRWRPGWSRRRTRSTRRSG